MRSFTWWQLCLVFLALGVAVAIPASVDAIPLRWPTSEEWISLLGLIFSWPVAAIIGTVYFTKRFYQPIHSYLDRVGLIKFPGVELQAAIPAASAVGVPTVSAPTQPEGDITVPGAPVGGDDAGSADDGGFAEHNISPLVNSDERINALELQSAQWKYAYLDIFLVHYTKRVLQWLAIMPQSRDVYEYIWQYVIPKEQREPVVQALVQSGLIREVGGFLYITEEGSSFLGYLRNLQKLPTENIPSVFLPAPPAPPATPAPTPAHPPVATPPAPVPTPTFAPSAADVLTSAALEAAREARAGALSKWLEANRKKDAR